MALPLIAAGIAARAVAKKLVTRATGGITGAGANQVNPIYRNQTNQIQKNSVKVKQKGPTKSQKDDMRHEMRQEQEKVSEKQLKEHYRTMYNQWNH